MAVHYHWGRRSPLRKALHRIRTAVPTRLRMAVWKWTARKVMERFPPEPEQPLFDLIALETRTRCNSACAFCAANVLTDTREDKYMPDDLVQKLYTELAALDYRGRLLFFVNNEPLLDPRLPEFLRQARTQLPHVTLEVHTNGLKLNPRNGRELLEAGLHTLIINNYTDQGTVHRGVQQFLDQVAPDFPEVHIDFHLRILTEKLANRGGTAPNGTLTREPFQLPCHFPFDYLGMTADGRVSLCCQDHYFDEVMGNFNRESIHDIWYGDRFKAARAALRNADRSTNPLCQVCDYRGFKDEHLSPTQLLANRAAGTYYFD